MSIHIETLGPGDAEQFLEVRYGALTDSPSSFFTTLEEAKLEREKYFRELLNPDDQHNLVFGCFYCSPLIGITGISRERHIKRRHIAWIESDYIKPEYRGRKLGKLLVSHAIEHARLMNGVDHLQLSVESGNTSARS